MELKELGNTGVKVPEIGLGTWTYRGGVGPLLKGISLGAYHIDTAEMYSTEGVVGEAARGQRDRVFIASKVLGSNLRYKEVMHAAENSLKRLGTDFIDLYQIHWPDPRVPIGETMSAMEELADMGKIRYIGVSNFSSEEMKRAQEAMRKYEIVSNQVLYNLFDRDIERSILPYCQRNNVTVIAFTPLGSGALASRPLLRRRHSMALLEKIALDTGKTMAQVALNWCIYQDNVIAIPKSNREDHVVEICGASGWRLSMEHMENLNTAFV